MALNETKTSTLLSSPAHWIDLDCWLETMYAFNATTAIFNMTAGDLEILAFGGSIEKQFDEAISNALKLFTTVYVNAIPPFFNGIVAGPLREAGNRWIYDKIHNASGYSCTPSVIPKPPVVPEGMVKFPENPVIKVTDFLLNDVVGADGPFSINHIFNQLTDNTGIGDTWFQLKD